MAQNINNIKKIKNKRTWKNKIKKNLLNFLVIATLPFFLTGCSIGGNNEKPVGTSGVVPKDRQITLIWWGLFEPVENVQPVIDAYNALYPNVTIEYSEKTLETYQANLDTVLKDGQPATTPDIFTIHNDWMGRYSNYVTAAPSEVIDSNTFQSTFYPVVSQDAIVNGTPKGIPLGMDSIALIYNKDLLEAKGYTAPATDWTQLLTQAKALTSKDSKGAYNTVGLSLGAGSGSEFWFDTFNLLLMQSQVQMLSSTNDQAIFADDTAATDAVSYVKNYETQGVWSPSLKQDIALFLEKKLAMYVAPSWRLLDIASYNKTYNLGIDYGIAPMPQISSLDAEKVGWADYWLQVVAQDSSNYKVAWDFLNFATQKEQQQLLFQKASENREFGQIYSRLDMKSELEKDTNLAEYINALSIAKSWKMVDGAQVKDVFEKWVNGEIDADEAESNVTQIITQTGFLSSSQ